jgi:predicted metalloendopeptidase
MPYQFGDMPMRVTPPISFMFQQNFRTAARLAAWPARLALLTALGGAGFLALTPDAGAQNPPRAAVPSGAVNPANFDSTTTPCQNFFQYVNSGRDVELRSGYDVRQHHEEAAVVQWLEKARAEAPTTADPLTRVLGTLYGSCLTGTSGALPCARDIRQRGLLTFYEGYRRHIQPPAWHDQVQATFKGLTAAASRRLRAAPWLTDSARQRALARLATMRIKVYTMREEPYQADYKSLVLSPTDFEENVTRIRAAEDAAYNRWAEASGRTAEERSEAEGRRKGYAIPLLGSTMLLGTYNGDINEVNIAEIFMQPPHFDIQGDPATNYGGVGWLFGHEIMHAFARPGVIFTEAEIAADAHADFQRRKLRLLEQLAAAGWRGGKVVTGFMAGKETKADNAVTEVLSSFGGRVIAYEAFEEAMRGKPRTLIGGFTPEQRFFITYADALRGRPGLDPVYLANIPGFARAFGCKAGDPMARPAEERVELY